LRALSERERERERERESFYFLSQENNPKFGNSYKNEELHFYGRSKYSAMEGQLNNVECIYFWGVICSHLKWFMKMSQQYALRGRGKPGTGGSRL
jgi:hypothetical protein